MSKPKTGAEKPLSLEQKELIVEEILGVHPMYLIKEGLNLKLDIYKLNADGKTFNEWKHTEHYHR